MKLFIKKIFYLIIMLFIISLISFLAINAAPNSFFASGELNPNITPESIEQLKTAVRAMAQLAKVEHKNAK
jgi:peptide/nickel transport system permease protein